MLQTVIPFGPVVKWYYAAFALLSREFDSPQVHNSRLFLGKSQHFFFRFMDRKSTHILSTSSNLLGFTFLVLTSIKGLGLPQSSLIDESVALCVALFALSSSLSFLSIRTSEESKSDQYESLADYVFLAGLAVITLVTVLMAFDIIVFKK